MEKSKPSYITGANVKCYSCFGKQFFKRLNNKVTMWPPNWQQPKTTIKSWSEEQSVVYLHNELSLSHKKEQSAELYYSVDEPWRQCQWKRPGPKPKHCTIYTVCPEQTNSQGQKIDGWFPGAGGRGQRGMAAPGHRVSFWSTELLWN